MTNALSITFQLCCCISVMMISGSAALSCLHIWKRFTGEVLKSGPDCQGDYCSAYQDAQGNIFHGCMTGLPSAAKTGCRKNIGGARLCICNDGNKCNTEERLRGAVDTLPAYQCKKFVDAPVFKEGLDSNQTCDGNVCYFANYTSQTVLGQWETQVSADCSAAPAVAFDVQIANMPPGMGAISGACYKTQTNGHQLILTCMCTGNNCNAKQPYSFSENTKVVECQTGENRIDEADHDYGTCFGQLCFLQKLFDLGRNQTLFSKGCMNITRSDIFKVGYRNIHEVEQWLCDQQFCNQHIATANSSTPGVNHQSHNAAATSRTRDVFRLVFMSIFVRLCILYS